MNATVEQALALWGLQGAEYQLVAARENAVYKVTDGARSYALRLHRKGYRHDAHLRSELMWMAAADRGGIKVPAPVESSSQALLHNVDNTQVDLLAWLPGQTLAEYCQATPEASPNLYYTLGQQMAKLHQVSDAWVAPADFCRPAWDIEGLVGENPLWDRFWENPTLTADEQKQYKALRTRLHADLALRHAKLDYGLIHADLVESNVMVHHNEIWMIDFDDGGFGYRLFELATALVKQLDAENYAQLEQALIDGYRCVRDIDLGDLQRFMLLRALTYVGWNITRLREPDALERNRRFIKTANTLAQRYLSEPDGTQIN